MTRAKGERTQRSKGVLECGGAPAPRKTRLFAITLSLSLLASCQSGLSGNEAANNLAEFENYVYTPPVELCDRLQTSEIDPEFLSPDKLKEGVRAVTRGEYPRIHSILVACNDKLVLEEYFSGYTYDGQWLDFDHTTAHGLASIAKSITAIIFSIACDNGFITDIDSSVLAWYPEYHLTDRTEKEAITIRHLLTMQSGLQWNEHAVSYNSRFNDVNRATRRRDPVHFILKKKLVHAPGTHFTYNSGNATVLGDIIFRSTGRRIDLFADEYLFGPLGVESAEWFSYNSDTIHAGLEMYLCPRDLLKIGMLILQKGMWNGRQIVSREWLEKTLHGSVFVEPWRMDYGFQWLRPRVVHPDSQQIHEPYVAAGRGGQYLMIYPEQKCILVMTGGNYNTKDASASWHDDYFLPALLVE